VDLAIDGTADPLELGGHLSGLLDREVNVFELQQVTIPLLERLVREGILVHEGVRGAGALWWSHAWTQLETDRPWYARMRDSWLARLRESGLGHG